MNFTYASGQRPLDGYTIKRGIGKGGFGEVYFAVSDGGKEVALKLLRDNADIELRGVTQCLNLKHPNLLVLYDLRTDARGDHWVLMEYIAGEPLCAVLARYPNGLSRQSAREWFLELARAVAYLHDRGIVHRDLKPGNLFVENGVLKVGDVGLSKAMSGTQRTAQTQSIGTVHYMAPEISTGNYTKTIDIYSLGVIFYEMLSGRVPFEGESAAEVLMKHLTAPPDLSKLPAEYVPLVSRALAKNPLQRQSSVAEMARELEGIGAAKPAPPPINPVHPLSAERVPVGPPTATFRSRLAELCGSMVLAVLFAGLGITLWAALASTRGALDSSREGADLRQYRNGDKETLQGGALDSTREGADLVALFFLAVAASWAVLLPAKFWCRPARDAWERRIVMLFVGAAVGLAGVWIDGWPVGLAPVLTDASPDGVNVLTGLLPTHLPVAASYLTYYALAFFALRWWRLTDPYRTSRFRFGPLLASAFWGLVLMLVVWPRPVGGVIVLVMAATIVQLVSPWEGPLPAPPRKLRLRYA